MPALKTPTPIPIRRRRRQKVALLAASTLALFASGPGVSAADGAPRPSQEFPMRIRMDVDGQAVLATLDDNAAARDFAALLPLSLTLTDYAKIERIADLPRKLSIEGAPAGVAPRAGDITYYAPWGNLAIFVEGRSYARGLVRLGRIESGLPALQRLAPLQVRIERIDE
jgi:hypothetical protein